MRVTFESIVWVRQIESTSCSVVSDSLRPHELHSPFNSLGQNTGVFQYWVSQKGSCFLLQGISPTQGSNPDLPHCRQILYHLSHQGSPRTLEWVAIPSPVDLPDPGIKPESLALQVDSLPAELPGKPQKASLKWHLKKEEGSEGENHTVCVLKISQAEEMAGTKGLKKRCPWYVWEKTEASMDWAVSNRVWRVMVPESQCRKLWMACSSYDDSFFTLHAVKKH